MHGFGKGAPVVANFMDLGVDINIDQGFPGGTNGKESTCNARDLGSILGGEDPLEKEMATHSSILAWRIAWTEEPGGTEEFMGLQRAGLT